jgi:hypothetical protein
VEKILLVMDDRGLIDLPLRVNGLEVKVSAVAPLAMAQNMEEINNILQFSQIAQSVGPEGAMAVKVGEMLDLIAEKLGVPQKIRRSAEERAQQMQQLAMAAEQNPEMAAQVVQGAV